MNRIYNSLIKSIGALALTGLAACDYIHDDSLEPCEYRLRLVYDYNMKFADAFGHEVTKAALFICDNKGNFIRRQDIEGAELKANDIAMDLKPGTYQVLTWAGLDDSSACGMLEPELTSVHIDCRRMGELSVARLQALLAGETDVPQVTVVPTELRVRGSS